MEYFELLRAHQGYLERIALAMLGNRPDAEDAMQEAALAGYQHFAALRGGQHAFGAWIRTILLRKCCRILDGRRRDHLRPVVVLRYMLDMSQQEVADALRIPVGTVKSRLGKALALLRSLGEEERRTAT